MSALAPTGRRVIELDVDRLRRRCSAALPAELDIETLEPLPGGASSLTYRARMRGSSLVIKVAPPGLEPVRNRDVLRQAAVLEMLFDAGTVPVPEIVFTLQAQSDADPPAFAMAFVDGDSYEPIMDGPGGAPPADDIRARVIQAAEILGRMHALEPELIGLSGEPIVTPADEIDRWSRALSRADLDDLAPAQRLEQVLRRAIPAPGRPALVHGDYRLGNMLAVGGEVRAVIDWEIWAVSDARLDLAWFLSLAEVQAQPQAVWQPEGMPSVAEQLEAYQRWCPCDLSELPWFAAASRFKQAAISALVVKNNRQRSTPDPAIERFALSLPRLFADGLQILKGA